MDWLLWGVSVLIALVGGFALNYLGPGKSQPPVVKVIIDDELNDEEKTGQKDLAFLDEGEEAEEKEDPENGPSELVIVAFRLPVKVTKIGDSWSVEWDDPFARNVFADLKILNRPNLLVKWVGTVPGPDVPKRDQFDLEEELEKYDCFPVFIPPDIKQKFYKGFCKGTLWPLFHYVMPQAVKLDTDFGTRWDSVWQGYRAGNMFFSKTVTRVIENNDDMIWIHGYHLLLVPSLVRRRLAKARIGLFVHEPWPSSDVFRSLPARENILRGMLACDLVGFQTYDYVRHFLSCCKRILNLDFKSLAGGSIGITYAGRSVAIRISHVGTRSEFFQKLSQSPQVLSEVKKLKTKYAGKTVMLSVDYMDLTKGPQMKLQSLHRFLRSHPEKAKTLVLAQVILPSSNPDKKRVEEIVMQEVKGVRNDYGAELIDVINNPPLHELVALYVVSHAAIISTFWDGLNLIPYEYTASQPFSNPGALVISEFMGCSRSLSGVIRVNPWSITDVAAAINAALEASLAKRQAEFSRRHKYVMAHTLEKWAKGFLKDLAKASKYNCNLKFVQVGFSSDVRLVGLRSDFEPVKIDMIRPNYSNSKNRLILLDYDGTLVGDSLTSSSAPTLQIKSLLQNLTSDPKNLVFIVSGRTRSDLFKWFGGMPQLGIAAENGCFVRWPERVLSYIESLPTSTLAPKERRSILPSLERQSSSWLRCKDTFDGSEKCETKENNAKWFSLCDPEEMGWKELAMTVIHAYNDRTDGAVIEDKEYAIVWRFEEADPDYGQMQAREMQKYLKEVIEKGMVDVVVYDDNKILEIRPKGIGKGLTTSLLVQTLRGYMKGSPLFLMAVGDDVSDEDMFSALENSSTLTGATKDSKGSVEVASPIVVTCCVGLKPSNARYYAHDPEEVREVLNALTVASRPAT